MAPPKFRTILLFPHHLYPSPTTLPLLTSLQSLLNTSFTRTYCSRPEIFGTSHIRLADPAKFVDEIQGSFTVAVFATTAKYDHPTTNDGDRVTSKNDCEGKEKEELVDLVATGSVKVVDEARTRTYARWAGMGARKASDATKPNPLNEENLAELDKKLQALFQERQNPPLVHELGAFGVSTKYQGLGLGVKVLEACEWLVGDDDGAEALRLAREPGVASYPGLTTCLSMTDGGQVHGVDLDSLRRVSVPWGGNGRDTVAEEKLLEKKKGDVAGAEGRSRQRSKMVLVAVREIGNEDYYRRRGYQSIGTGVLPVGTWGSKAECTSVFMEKYL